MAGSGGATPPFITEATLKGEEMATPGAACTIGTRVFHAYCDGSRQVCVAWIDLAVWLRDRDATVPDHWAHVVLNDRFPKQPAPTFRSSRKPALAAVGDTLFVVWRAETGAMQAARLAADGSWTSAALHVHWADAIARKQVVHRKDGAIAACTAPDGCSVIVAVLAATDEALSAYNVTMPKGASLVATALFRAAEFKPFGTWTGHGDVVQLGGDATIVTTYTEDLAIAWFTQGSVGILAPGTPPRAPPALEHILVLVCYDSKDHRALSFAWTIDDAGRPWACSALRGEPAAATLPAAVNGGFTGREKALSRGVTLLRDPAGRVIALYAEHASKDASEPLCHAVFLPSPGTAERGLHAPAWTGGTLLLKPDGKTVAGTMRPSATFVGLPVETGPSPVPLPPPEAQGQSRTYANCLLQRQLLFAFTAEKTGKSAVHLSVFGYGTSVCALDYRDAAPPQPDALVLSLVADTFPFPVPDIEVWQNDSPSGMVNWACCSYDYLIGNEREIEATVEAEFSIGFRLNLMTTKGAGIASESAASAGIRAAVSQGRQVGQATLYSVETKGTKRTDLPDEAPMAVRNLGALFGFTAPTMTHDMAFFVNASNHLVYGREAPGQFIVRPSRRDPPPPVAAEFTLFGAIQGDLASYDPARINAMMQWRYQALDAGQRRDFVIDGTDYGYLYTSGKGYVAEVVEAFGAACFGSSGDRSHLDFAVSAAGMTRAEYQETSRFTAAGGIFAEASSYNGIGFGEELSFAGVGVAMENSVMVGFETRFSLQALSAQAASWGVRIAEYLNPLRSGQSYTARMHFLKPHPIWAVEVRHFGLAGQPEPPCIDTRASRPVRILFTVPHAKMGSATAR